MSNRERQPLPKRVQQACSEAIVELHQLFARVGSLFVTGLERHALAAPVGPTAASGIGVGHGHPGVKSIQNESGHPTPAGGELARNGDWWHSPVSVISLDDWWTGWCALARPEAARRGPTTRAGPFLFLADPRPRVEARGPGAGALNCRSQAAPMKSARCCHRRCHGLGLFTEARPEINRTIVANFQ
jgi:hypothetical protein